MAHRTRQRCVSLFRRGTLALLFVSLFALLGSALPSEAFQGGRLPGSFDRGRAFAEFASRVDGRVADIPAERTRGDLRHASSAEETAKARLDAGYGKFPLLFEENGGQSVPEVAFTVKGSDKTLYFTPEGLTFSLAVPREPDGENPGSRRLASRLEERGKPGEEAPRERWTLKLDFVDAARVRPEGEKRSGTVISYFKGPESEHRSGVPTYNSIVYRDLWPGIDLVYDGDANHLKYRFVVRPGADPERIRLAYRGAEHLSVDSEGGLEIVTAAGVLRDDVPVSWQETENGRVPVNATYALGRSDAGNGGPNTSLDYGFSVESYDPTKELIIDPVVLIYCGYIGGSGYDWGEGIAVDGSGNAYVTGDTYSDQNTFPEKVGPDLTYNGDYDAFVAKVNAAGTGLVYCGYIGGSGGDWGSSIAVDASGNAYVTGYTDSGGTSFPVKVGPDLTHNCGSDAFVAKVNAAGTGLVYCGYIGGSSHDDGRGIAVDGAGNAYVTGYTLSGETSFPVKVGPDLTHNGDDDVFVAKVNAAGTALVYCGYIGGSGYDWGNGIAVDGSGNAYVTGYTDSGGTSFPVKVGPDLTHNGNVDAFVAKVNAGGTGLVYCGYIGGSGYDWGNGIAVDGSGNAYVTGYTDSGETSFPVKVGPDLTHNGNVDAFVAKVNADGSGLVYCGYIGGSLFDDGSGIAVDGEGNAYVTGYTESGETTFPVKVGPDLTHNSSCDAFAAKVNAAGTGLVYCGYIGGSLGDSGRGIVVDGAGNAYVTGSTLSTQAQATFPVKVGPDQTHNGGSDAFVAKIGAPTFTNLPLPFDKSKLKAGAKVDHGEGSEFHGIYEVGKKGIKIAEYTDPNDSTRTAKRYYYSKNSTWTGGNNMSDLFALDLGSTMPTTQILAIEDGEVHEVNINLGYVEIKHGTKLVTSDSFVNKHTEGLWFSGYMHMKDVVLKKGATVKKGNVLGTMSDKGSPGSLHLHFAVYDKDGYSFSPWLLGEDYRTLINYLNDEDGNPFYKYPILPETPKTKANRDKEVLEKYTSNKDPWYVNYRNEATTPTPPPTPPAGSIPDFNGDGKADLIWQEITSNQLYVWYMNGAARIGGQYLTPSTIAGKWRIVGTGDFNGDGKTDLVWQEMASNQLYVWYMNGVTRTGGQYLNPPSIGGKWRIVGTGDFNGDGKPDLVWQEMFFNHLYVWFMNGAARTGGQYLNPLLVGGKWRIVGVGDFNGDGKTDLVWQEMASKQLYVWYMNGVTRTGGQYLNPANIEGNWKIVAVQDMNGDGKPDLVWQEMTKRELYVWYMNGVNRTGGQYLTPPSIGGGWRISHSGAWSDLASGGASLSSEASFTPPEGDASRPSVFSEYSTVPEGMFVETEPDVSLTRFAIEPELVDEAILSQLGSGPSEGVRDEPLATPPEGWTASDGASEKSAGGCRTGVASASWILLLLPALMMRGNRK